MFAVDTLGRYHHVLSISDSTTFQCIYKVVPYYLIGAYFHTPEEPRVHRSHSYSLPQSFAELTLLSVSVDSLSVGILI